MLLKKGGTQCWNRTSIMSTTVLPRTCQPLPGQSHISRIMAAIRPGIKKHTRESAVSRLSSPSLGLSYRPIASLWASVPLGVVHEVHFRACLFDFVFFQVSYLNSLDFFCWRNYPDSFYSTSSGFHSPCKSI